MITRSPTLPDLLDHGRAESPALGAPGRPALDFAALRRLVDTTGRCLRQAGLARHDRVGIMLPNGPDMAAAFLCVASACVAAPLNPAYGAQEIEFALVDLDIRAVILLGTESGAARQVAGLKGIPILDLTPLDAAGDFTLSVPANGLGPAQDQPATPDDVALVLHTSGTTAKPKIVPLSHANLAASARNIGTTLALRPDDVCLNIMPLFHIHGLVAAVLAAVAAGGSVVCCPGLNAFRFFTWFDQARATWFTAVPTMHQTLLELAPRHAETLARGRLRLIRSSSASLPGPVMTRLEATFGVPVIEAYGMTEASHQMTSNPLPPRARHAGSVGVAAGPEVAIMAPDGTIRAAGEIGEVVIRGTNVTKGYEAAPAANAQAFVDGWFRTGDEGVIDAEGYLRLTGRLKEIINRAGEKISPLEVEAVLMQHPAVLQVVVFAMASRRFGEEVAAAAVLRDEASVDEPSLRTFAASRMAGFKVPQRIVFLAEIPKGATGKLQRIGLAARLGLDEDAPDVPAPVR